MYSRGCVPTEPQPGGSLALTPPVMCKCVPAHGHQRHSSNLVTSRIPPAARCGPMPKPGEAGGKKATSKTRARSRGQSRSSKAPIKAFPRTTTLPLCTNILITLLSVSFMSIRSVDCCSNLFSRAFQEATHAVSSFLSHWRKCLG